jgi:uncharacterized membrane protein
MLYNSIKIFHIVSAAVLLTSMAMGINLWYKNHESSNISHFLQIQTVAIFIPVALLQLATGFTMISLKHYSLSQTWIAGSIFSFLIVIVSWFAFIYLYLHMQLNKKKKTLVLKQLQFCLLSLCCSAILSMIFFMANKTL